MACVRPVAGNRQRLPCTAMALPCTRHMPCRQPTCIQGPGLVHIAITLLVIAGVVQAALGLVQLQQAGKEVGGAEGGSGAGSC